MMTSTFKLLKRSGIPINWGTIQVGWFGLGHYNDRMISPEELVEYAFDIWSASIDNHKCLNALAILSKREFDEISGLVDCLANICKYDEEFEILKWQIILLRQQIDELPDDPFEGNMALAEFWLNFGYPDDNPIVVQGRTITPQKYYTKQNYENLIIMHKNWVKSKLEYVMGARVATK